MNASIDTSRRTISSPKKTPPKGAVKVALTPAATPQATSSRSRESDIRTT